MDITKCYLSSGHFSQEQYFIQKFGQIPSVIGLTFNDESDHCDISKLTDDIIRTLIPDADFIRRRIFKYTTAGKFVDTEVDQYDVINLSDSGTIINISSPHYVLYTIDFNSITCYYSLDSESEVNEHCIDLWKKLPKKDTAPKECTVNLVGYSEGSYYTIESKIKSLELNIEESYNDDFIPVYNDIINFLDSRDSGLIMLYGTQGTGKTSLIRHLCYKKPASYIIVPTSLISRLGDPDFVAFMIDHSNSVFILEDCEQILMDRSINMFNGAISNILNMSDGLLSDIMNLKFICTFNADIKTIDSALLRKGRCYAKYEFKKLSADKVANLNEKYNLGLSVIKDMTLADAYNADKTEYTEKKVKRQIGF